MSFGFLESISLILEKGENTTFYKFSLLRSLIDYGKTYPNQPLIYKHNGGMKDMDIVGMAVLINKGLLK